MSIDVEHLSSCGHLIIIHIRSHLSAQTTCALWRVMRKPWRMVGIASYSSRDYRFHSTIYKIPADMTYHGLYPGSTFHNPQQIPIPRLWVWVFPRYGCRYAWQYPRVYPCKSLPVPQPCLHWPLFSTATACNHHVLILPDMHRHVPS